MKLLANENFPFVSVKFLKSQGYDIISVGVDIESTTDREIIAISDTQNRTIVTFDRDYGELIYKFGIRPSAGVIYLRLRDFNPEYPGRIIHELLTMKDIDVAK